MEKRKVTLGDRSRKKLRKYIFMLKSLSVVEISNSFEQPKNDFVSNLDILNEYKSIFHNLDSMLSPVPDTIHQTATFGVEENSIKPTDDNLKEDSHSKIYSTLLDLNSMVRCFNDVPSYVYK